MSLLEACNVRDFILSASALSAPSLDLSRKGICELPNELPGCSKLECLYLEGNHLTSLPESLFTSCPNLRWLDLRNNKLQTLPPSIKKLKCLRTLLLEGNQLTTLPSQLGKLRHLRGLNLSHNPLHCPPKHVVEKGTKVVLKYLQELLCEEVEYNDSFESVEGTSAGRKSQTQTVIHRDSDTARSAAKHCKPAVGSLPGLPLPLHSQVTLYTQPSLARRMQATERSRDGTPSPEIRSNTRSHRRRRKDKHVSSKPPQLSIEQRQEITAAVEKQKSAQCLEDWRDEVRDQQQMRVLLRVVHPRTAPFATDDHNVRETEDAVECRLQAMDGQRSVMSKLHNLRNSATSSNDSLRDLREHEVTERVMRYTVELQDKRRQAGLIQDPSLELLEAEKRLAEAMARRKEFEARKNREYRLTAFTGDLPLGHWN